MSSEAGRQPALANIVGAATCMKGGKSMKYALLVLTGAAVAFSSVPADARHVERETIRVGYSFGPSYAYTDYGTLPQPVVRRYHLHNNFRYVNRDGLVYVVNPRTYRVVRVIRAG
jgi:hypothetical protein